MKKFSILYFKFKTREPPSALARNVEKKVSAEEKNEKKYIECIRKFRLLYKEPKTNIYIRNCHNIYEHFFTFDKLLSYKAKLEQK